MSNTQMSNTQMQKTLRQISKNNRGTIKESVIKAAFNYNGGKDLAYFFEELQSCGTENVVTIFIYGANIRRFFFKHYTEIEEIRQNTGVVVGEEHDTARVLSIIAFDTIAHELIRELGLEL